MKESEGLYRSFRFLKRALIGLAVALLALLAFGYFVFMRQVDKPEAWAAAERELQGGALHYGERIEKQAKVFMRRPTDYFRGANGILYATNDRILFVGIAPGDKLEKEDAPEVIVSQEFPNDTLLTMKRKRLYFMTAPGVSIAHPGQPASEFAASRGSAGALKSLIDHVESIHTAQREAAASEKRLRAAVAAMIREPLYYTIKRGDALSLVATKFDATPDQIRAWNSIVGDRIRIGDKLLVKPAKK
ncbi:MAG TPA: LysM peptidoglycan-binding domain-containing protein [Gemmatimonadaceae bacterium]|nr:LysM peptidoglycan-binding domain-containing protein [Gemmatimonadaceae bacterium]